ncbi:MAG: PAS domain-containing sensor histidine kinase [Comamonadaceae bacterium]|nr:PAS domain-containing sensor histidine kinase [Comamonadaceae bacterium]
MSARWWVPLLLVLFSLVAMGLRHGHQMRAVEAEVRAAESRHLLERLSVKQSRLDAQNEVDNTLLVRRMVSSLALHEGLDRAYLVDPQQRVLASLSRLDMGRSVGEVLQAEPDQGGLRALFAAAPVTVIKIGLAGEGSVLTALVPLRNGDHLGVRVDLQHALALARLNVQTELAREAVVLGAAVLALALLLHLLWFRRAQTLARALGAMGQGQLSARAALGGRDELALIGAAADRMAGQLQAGQERIRRLSDIIGRSPLVVIEWRNAPGWPVRYVSDSVAQWGYPPADFLDGKLQYNDLFHPDDVQRVNAEIAGYFEHGPDAYRQEYRIRRADGGWAWVDDRTSLTRDGSAQVISISGVLLDVSAQKEAERAQREQAELLRMFYELPFLGMAISSPSDKRWLQVNDRLCEMLGYPREELLRMTWAEMTPPGDRERNVALFDEVMAGVRDGYRMTKRFVRKDGSLVHTEIDVRAVRDEAGRVKQLFATVQDITERLLAAQALHETKDMLEQAEAVSLLGSWALDNQTQRLVVSAQLFRNLGLEPGPCPPSDEVYLERIHPEDRQRVAQDMQHIRDGKEAVDLVFRTNTAHGPARWLRRTARRISREDQGQKPRYIGTLHDITEAVQAEDQLRQINQELERRVAERTAQLSQANQELETFSYSVSHDLKAPLRGIDGYSQLLVEEYGSRLDEEGRQFVRRIRQGVQQMAALITDLLEYSRMERRDMEAEPVALRALVQQILDGYEADIRRQGVQLQLDMEPFTLALDHEGMAVVLRNLIGNALKFSHNSQPPRVEIGSRSEAGRRILWVRDNGVGFDMKYHDRLFGIFQRLHRAEEFPGTGVGLALVAKAVQRMGGRVWAESTPGAGATFYLEFPE